MCKKFLLFFIIPLTIHSQIVNISDNATTSINHFLISNENIKYVFWTDDDDSDFDIFFKKYSNEIWSDVFKINTPNDIKISSLLIEETNSVHILWYEDTYRQDKLIYGEILDSILIDSTTICDIDSSDILFTSCIFDSITQELFISYDFYLNDSVFTFYSIKDKNNNWLNNEIIINNSCNYSDYNRRTQLVKDITNALVCLWYNADSMSIDVLKKQDDNTWVEGVRLTDESNGIGLDFIAKNDNDFNIHIVSHPAMLLTCPCNVLLYSKWDGNQWLEVELVPSSHKYAYFTEHDFPGMGFSRAKFPVIVWEQNSYNEYLYNYENEIGTAVRTDSGWNINRKISTDSDPKYPAIVVDENQDLINYIWSDTSDGDYDIYFQSTPLITSIKIQEKLNYPERLKLFQNYPNPFNPNTTISFYLQIKSKINLNVYNVLGKKIRNLFTGEVSKGHHSIVWDGTNINGNPVNSGLYIYRLKSKENIITKKMVLIR